MDCRVCKKKITEDVKIVRCGYLSTICRLCSNEENKIKQRKKAKILKESRRW